MFNRPRKLELDYIAPARRRPWLGVLMLATSLGVASELWLQYRDARLELERFQVTGGLVSAERRPARAAPRERLEDESRSAEAVVRQLTLPWASVIRAIERAATRDVAILQLQPDAESRLLRLTAEARHRDAMFEYVRRLGAAKELADVHVVSHQVQRDAPQRPVQFSVQASLRSAP
jgi:hypothetical protein